jgi:hypothetical protein
MHDLLRQFVHILPKRALRFVITHLRGGSCGDETAEPPDDQATFKPNK